MNFLKARNLEEGQIIVRIKGSKTGSEAEFFHVSESLGVPLLTIRYLPNGPYVWGCHPRNFVLKEEYESGYYERSRAYRPSSATLRELKQKRPFKLGGKKYVVLFYGWVDQRLIESLIKRGWFGPKQRFAELPGRRMFAKENPGIMPPDGNASVYEVRKPLKDFSWG